MAARLSRSGGGNARIHSTIVIDPGHGGIDGGAEGPAGTMEKNITLAFAEAFKEALEAAGRNSRQA
jgi:N-acetylmuramoyl-L-alanine amidase